MLASFLLPFLFILAAAAGWHGFARRIADDVAEWEITPQEGRSDLFLYRSWSVGLALVGVTLAILTLGGK